LKKSAILILDPRGNISLGGLDVIRRHEKYGKDLALISNKLKLIVFSSSNLKSSSLKSSFLDIFILTKPTINSVKFAWRSCRSIKKEQIDVKLLVTGDPWESFWTALLLRKFLSKNIPIQIQIHGDIANPVWKYLNLRNYLRYYLARLLCNKADMFRAVGNSQKTNLIKNLKIVKSKIDVIPVPINFNSLDLSERKYQSRAPNIAMIGRIHKDRGINNFLQLLEKLSEFSNNFNVILIGSGKKESQFVKSVKKIIGSNRVRFLGQVSGKSLSKYWKEIDLLVSLAPVESYGLVMREALVSGVPVWALESSGSLDLLTEVKTGQIRLLNLNNESEALFKQFNNLLKVRPSSNFKRIFIEKNKNFPSQLVASWLKSIEK
jgi:glycosyltransferase involved in cell wall biosynthesis